jgi:hypothetical protein
MSKYDSLRKTERNRLLVVYATEHPSLSYGEVGKVFGLSKQRVAAIVKKYGQQSEVEMVSNKG